MDLRALHSNLSVVRNRTICIFLRLERNNLLKYVNEEKKTRWNLTSGSNSLRGSNESVRVLTEKDLVNIQSQYPGYYQN